jgi:hypothetical protein
MFMAAAAFAFAALRSHKTAFVAAKEKFSLFARSAMQKVPQRDVFQTAIQSIKDNIALTRQYQSEPPLSERCSKCDALPVSDCKECSGTCEWHNTKCRKQTPLMPSGWKIRQLSPTSVFAPANNKQFLELVQLEGESSPIVWKTGYIVRWKGRSPQNKEVSDGDYVVTKVEIEGDVRRIYLDTADPLVGIWNMPQVYLTNYEQM